MPTIGSQALVRILPRTRYDFGGLRDAVVKLPVAQHIDVLGFERATLQVRVYSGTLPTKSSLQVHLADDGFSADDSATVFLQTARAGGEDIGTLQILDQTVFPFYQSISTVIPGVLGRLMAVMVSFTGGPKGGPCVDLSMDLVLTGGSVGSRIYQPSTYLGYAHEPVESVESFDQIASYQVGQVGQAGQAGQAGSRDELLASHLLSAIRDALLRNNPDLMKPDDGYPRFGNVNVAIEGSGHRPDVGEGKLATVLSSAIRDALVRGDLNLDTPDGGYARFGNVNVGIGGSLQRPDVGEERLAAVLASAIREALRRGDLDVATPDGGYARFGNVNIGIGANVRLPDIEQGLGTELKG